MGGAAQFEPFMRSYLQAFAFKTVSSDEFKQYFLNHFKDNPAGLVTTPAVSAAVVAHITDGYMA